MAAALPEACANALGVQLDPELFKALCDPNRLSLLARLAVADEPMTVSNAAGCCGVHISGVSRHLAILRRAGVVDAKKRGREVAYTLNHEALTGALRGLADAIDSCRPGCCTPASTEGESK